MIKHGCIKDPDLFALLEKNTLTSLRSNLSLLGSIVERNVLLKSEVVQKDEFEKGERRLLNFGHTLAHAIENKYQLSHGQAVSIGMVAAATLSTAINGFKETDNTRLLNVLQQYHLPVHFEYDKQQTFATLLMDKKREGTTMHYVLLSAIGQAVVKSIPLNQLKDLLFK
jgi:3-dehydroquinate synthase